MHVGVVSSLTALLCLRLQALLSEGWISFRLNARQSMPIISVQVFFGRPGPRTPVGLGFWTFFSQPSLRSIWPCHLSRRVQSTFARSSNCIVTRISWELTCFLVVTSHIQQIIQAMQGRLGWGPGFACMGHGVPNSRIINSSSGGDGKWASGEVDMASLNLPHATRHCRKLWWHSWSLLVNWHVCGPPKHINTLSCLLICCLDC